MLKRSLNAGSECRHVWLLMAAGRSLCLRWRSPHGPLGRGLCGWAIPFPWGPPEFALCSGQKRRGKSPPAQLEESGEQTDHPGLLLRAGAE